MQIALGNAADVRVAVIHRDVIEVVEPAEDAEFSHFGDTGQEAEAELAVPAFHQAAKALQAAAESFPQRLVACCVQQRLVVFVYQNHDRSACLFISRVNDILETDIGFGISGCDAAIFSQSKIGCGSA